MADFFNKINTVNDFCVLHRFSKYEFLIRGNGLLTSLKQAFWKGFKQRKSYVDRLKVLQGNVAAIVKVRTPSCLGAKYVLSLFIIHHHLGIRD